MKNHRTILVACALLFVGSAAADAQSPLDRARRDEIVSVPSDDPAMEAAFARARATLDDFLKVLAAPPPDTRGFAVKLPIRDGGKVEYFWVIDIEREGDRFTGRINNTPRSVRTVREGQVIAFMRADIRDWMYLDEARQRMIGNFTLCALLTREKPAHAAEMKRTFGLTCD